MCRNGFQKISHSFFDNWQWRGDAFVTCVYLWLLDGAVDSTKYVYGVELKYGQLLTSVDKICAKTCFSRNSVKNSLKKLKESGEITEEVKPNKYRIITITHYNENTSGDLTVGRSKTNSKTNSKTPYKEIKKCVCLTDTHTHKKEEAASAPHALGERASAVTYGDIRQFQIDNHIGGGEYVSEFYNAFEKSGTRIPDNWQDLYIRYVRAGWKAQNEFIDRLEKGEYIEKWGRADV